MIESMKNSGSNSSTMPFGLPPFPPMPWAFGLPQLPGFSVPAPDRRGSGSPLAAWANMGEKYMQSIMTGLPETMSGVMSAANIPQSSGTHSLNQNLLLLAQKQMEIYVICVSILLQTSSLMAPPQK